MDFKVDYVRIFDIGEILERENEELNKLLENLLKIIDNLSNCWSGTDYENFRIAATTYIKNLSLTITDIEYIGKFMQKASRVYSNSDEEWAKQVDKIGADEKWHIA